MPAIWERVWTGWKFEELAFEIFSLYIDSNEIPSKDLKDIVGRSYSTFRAPDVTPLVTLDQEKQLYLLELFHGPTFAFKDVALQLLGNLFEYFLLRKNGNKPESERDHLTVVGATSGDTGSAAIYGLRSKKDVDIMIMFPEGKVSPVQEAQMTSVLDKNVHNVAVDGSFDDCQDFVKELFGDADIRRTHQLAAVNSINFARILAQISYYAFSLGRLFQDGRITAHSKVRFVVPTGNFGDVLAGYFAKRMGFPIERLVVATNENDILDRFWKTGYYEKKPIHGQQANGGFVQDGVKAHEDGVRETFSPAMDILVSSNFERLLWFLAFQVYGEGLKTVEEKRAEAGKRVKGWLHELKTKGGFGVESKVLEAAKMDFESERVSNKQTIGMIKQQYTAQIPAARKDASTGTAGATNHGKYILDPHSAIGVAAALRSIERAPPPGTTHVALATAHPAKFSKAVEKALENEKDFQFRDLLPEQFIGLEELEKRKYHFEKSEGIEGLRRFIREQVKARSNSDT
ncbi:MAG: threonine synthase [Alectoria fallacina]|uniref:threonine synthase n=1 Tax=Alectoria fallacina TaxID=1903189 RepID=A0A8H3IRQ9_9LECA|nr:MAG: threonine synthase [Alectoria fallacina]